MHKGFTLLELTALLIVLGVLSYVIISRVDFNPEEEITLDIIKNHMRYMQLISMNSDYICGVQFESKKYFGFCDIDNDLSISDNEKLLLPGTDQYDVEVDFISVDENKMIIFDLYGRPYSSFLSNESFGGEIEIGAGKRIYVTKETGYIP